ncbi:hypothetical protein HMPREF0682_0930 [Propionibacterium acidifaciens F0233]|uniref:Uncharacterized protein n=1 Tax=Propionibacterium acidifaciens F0233 TaxID=553198 RepID=U2RK99_9ACTN|nr:hypothetical protein [Propionibacterium acidifaciens]ERK51132.1 hypothetical protein HMPREF0682_0930 [Propionibacterium acidifaciens F0233]
MNGTEQAVREALAEVGNLDEDVTTLAAALPGRGRQTARGPLRIPARQEMVR